MNTFAFLSTPLFIFFIITTTTNAETFFQKIFSFGKKSNSTNLFPFKLFQPSNGTVSKFGPVLEYFLQRIQAQNSIYIHEDLSRPQTWDKPVYTLSPEDEAFLASFETTTEEILFEIIKDEDKNQYQKVGNETNEINGIKVDENENKVIVLTNQTVQFNNGNIYGTSHIQTSVILSRNNKNGDGNKVSIV